MKIFLAAHCRQAAVPGARPSSGASEARPCDLIFKSAELNIAITTLKHLPLLNGTSCMGLDSVGAPSMAKIDYLYGWILY